MTRREFFPPCHSPLCPLQYVCSSAVNRNQLRSEWCRVKCTHYLFISGHSSSINVAQVAMWNHKIGSIFYTQNWMADTNTTLSVTTGNEVSTLGFGCEYHTWPPGDFKYSCITALLHSEVPSDNALSTFPYSKKQPTFICAKCTNVKSELNIMIRRDYSLISVLLVFSGHLKYMDSHEKCYYLSKK